MSFTKKLMSALVASSLVLGTVSTAFAAPSADEVNNAFARLNHYGIVQGVAGPGGEVSPNLEGPITRAQLLTILVRAWGQEANAKLLTGATTGFSDVDGAGVDWATGYIFIGNRIAEANGGQKLGTSATTFNPNGELSAVEVLAFTMKFLGLKVGSGDTWAADTIKMAKEAGLITDADEAKYLADPGAKVNRGQAFGLLDSLFAGYNKLPGGKTVYTTFVDTTAPELTVNKPELTTDKAALTVTGSVKGDYAAVYLGSEKLTVNADGTFSVDVPLNVGANNIVFTAMDMVGNTDEESFTVTRNPGVAAKITATMPAEVVAGESVDVAVTVTDANGVALPVAATDITVTASGSVGTYADGKFTAAEKVGTGTLTFSYGDLTPATVEVKVVPGPLAQVLVSDSSVAKGEVVTLTPADKFGNAIASGVTYTWEGSGIAVTSGGTVYTSAPGVYKVTAKSGEATAEATIGVYGDIAKLKIELPETIVANGETRKAVTVVALDEFGNKITAYGDDDTPKVELESSGVKFYTKAKKADDPDADFDKIQLSFKDGVATAYFAVDSALAGEELTFTASHTPSADADKISVEATADAVVPVATALKIDSIPTYLAANAPKTATVDVIVVDQEGVAIDEAYEITAALTGPAVLVDDTADYNGADSVATFTIDNAKSVGVEGTISLTFTAEGIGSVTGEIKHVVAGNPAKLAVTTDVESSSIDDVIKVTVEVQDRNGVPVTFDEDLTDAIVIKLSEDAELFDVSTDTDPPVSKWVVADKKAMFDLPADTSSVTFLLETVDEFTGNVTINASFNTKDHGMKFGTLTGSKTVSFTPGEVDGLSFTKGTIWAPVVSPTATFVVNLADKFGNTVAKSDVELAVYVDDSTVTVNGVKTTDTKPYKIKTDANGQAKLEVKARPYAGRDYTITVKETSEGSEIEPVTAAFSVKETVVASITTKLYKEVKDEDGNVTGYIPATNIKAGERVFVVATVKDNYGGEYVFDEVDGNDLSLLTGVADEVLDEQYGTATDDGDDDDIYTKDFTFGLPSEFPDFSTEMGYDDDETPGVYIAEVVAGKAGVTSLGAKFGRTETTVSKTSSVKVNAGAIASVVVNGGEDIEVTDTGVVYGPYTISLADAYGNTVALSKNATIWLEDLPNLTFRKTEGGATTTAVTTRSTTNFYFVATAEDTYNVDVMVDFNGNGVMDAEDFEIVDAFTIVVDDGE